MKIYNLSQSTKNSMFHPNNCNVLLCSFIICFYFFRQTLMKIGRKFELEGQSLIQRPKVNTADGKWRAGVNIFYFLFEIEML